MRKKNIQTVKIDDVALHASVSPSTVSLYIRKPEKVSKKTGDKIQKSIDDLGYVYNKIASQFTGSKSKIISIVVPSISNEVFGDILQQLEELISQEGFQLKIASHDHNLQKEEDQIRSMLEWSPSVLIVTGQEHTEAATKVLKSTSASVIQLMDLGGNLGSQVGLNHNKAGYDTTRYLIESGCKKIAYFTTRFDDDIRAQKRYKGYCKALNESEHSHEPVLIDIPYTRNSYDDTRRYLSQALANHRGIDGIIATNDAIGIGVLLEANHKGIAIPETLSVIGFGDFSISSCLSPISLSSVNLNSHLIAQELAKISFESYHDENFTPRMIDTSYNIIPRDSTKLIY
ncbi:LacI family DNA-binding transcriptional regulator [Vibrio splendidus]|uniref:LacI family DNA-binding transcriptional regulator n=1 Tax=Vibrio splendidus TaxID=29497 RepID=UPI0007F959E2|nr:LacI family DNA-binding transcriptional regulator [Vibrio splendidus]OBT24583.1 LacI family transcriptional regulator [Vibrio splendidus]